MGSADIGGIRCSRALADGPGELYLGYKTNVVFPRARGWTLPRRRLPYQSHGVPTHSWMDLGSVRWQTAYGGVPARSWMDRTRTPTRCPDWRYSRVLVAGPRPVGAADSPNWVFPRGSGCPCFFGVTAVAITVVSADKRMGRSCPSTAAASNDIPAGKRLNLVLGPRTSHAVAIPARKRMTRSQGRLRWKTS